MFNEWNEVDPGPWNFRGELGGPMGASEATDPGLNVAYSPHYSLPA